IKSTFFADANASVGTGNVVINAGGGSFTVTLTAGNDSLSNLRDAINQAPDNSGVTATIINASDGAHLLLSATKTGLANAVSVDATGLSGGDPFAFASARLADDAQVFIDGLEYDSASNVISDAIGGVTLNLVSAQPNVTQTLTVSPDINGAASAVQSFV